VDLGRLPHLGLAIALGLLVGLQREWADKEIAGIRTFPLIVLFGLLAGVLGLQFGGWVVAACAVTVAVAIVIGNVSLMREGHGGPGITTELAVLVMFATGGLLALDRFAEAIVVTGCVTVLLHWKTGLHAFVDRMGAEDLRAVARLVLIGLIILPVLPNRDFGPYDVLNPFEIWLVVVLIVGISLVAYVASRLLGPRSGSLLGGMLGGLISSTATTVTYARQSKGQPDRAPGATLVIVVASCIVFARVLLEIGLVAPSILGTVTPPLLTMMAWLALLGAFAFLTTPTRVDSPDQEPPSELKAAVTFGVLYALVLLGVAVAKKKLGTGGLFAVAALSGMTDMDAITLSTAQLIKADQVEASTGWRLILVGSMANLVFKGGVVAALGHARLRLRVAAYFAAALAGGGAILWLWP